MAKIRPFAPYNFLQIEPERHPDKFAELSTIGMLKIHFLKNLKFIVLYGKCIVKVMIEPERYLDKFAEFGFCKAKVMNEPERHLATLFLCRFYEVKLLNSVFAQAGV